MYCDPFPMMSFLLSVYAAQFGAHFFCFQLSKHKRHRSRGSYRGAIEIAATHLEDTKSFVQALHLKQKFVNHNKLPQYC